MDGAVGVMLVVALSLAGGMVLAMGVVTLLGGASRMARRRVDRARGGGRPDWAPGIWHCAHCLSTNRHAATRCERCRRPREDLVHAPAAPRPDWLPAEIVVPDGIIATLIHRPDAHGDPSKAHWGMAVGGRTEGSAARRDGALALLRALQGTDVVWLDVRGTGPSAFRLADAIARFEAPRFPLDVTCPERTD